MQSVEVVSAAGVQCSLVYDASGLVGRDHLGGLTGFFPKETSAAHMLLKKMVALLP